MDSDRELTRAQPVTRARAQTQPRPQQSRSGRAARKRGPRRFQRWAVGAAVAVLAAVVAGAVALFSRGEGGGALSVLRTADFHAVAFSPEDANVIFFGHYNGMLRSADGGRTWQPLVDRRNFDAMGLAISRANPRQVYLAGHDIF